MRVGMAFEHQKTKQKPQRMDVSDWAMLHEIGKAIEAREGHLTQVRRDSAEWAAWRSWMHQRGITTVWLDARPPEHLITVTMPYPPFSVTEEYKKQIKSRGKALELDE